MEVVGSLIFKKGEEEKLTQRVIDCHTHRNIYLTPPVTRMCTQQLSALH